MPFWWILIIYKEFEVVHKMSKTFISFPLKSLTKSQGTKKKKKPRVHILQENSVYFDSSNILVNIHQLWHLGLKSLIDKKEKTKFLVGQIQLM